MVSEQNGRIVKGVCVFMSLRGSSLYISSLVHSSSSSSSSSFSSFSSFSSLRVPICNVFNIFCTFWDS